jgi:FkbM family methyltransferase
MMESSPPARAATPARRPRPRAGFRSLLSPGQRLRYLAWRAGLGAGGPLTVRLANGRCLILRPPPATDLNTAMEIFFCGAYQPPRSLAAERMRMIVDLGSNVGYSIVYLSQMFPEARIDAFEPHPTHVRQIHQHVEANALRDRVTVYAVAVGARARRMLLSDAENRSTLVGESGVGRIEVPVVDWLALAAGQPIDLLKMDIEGSEYEILLDPRFEALSLSVANLVVEWHRTPEHPDGGAELARRLQDLGYQVEPGVQNAEAGLLWSYRRP